MSELRRKYDGVKQAHKELSVEVVHLRSRLALAERVVERAKIFRDCKISDKEAMQQTEDELYKALTAYGEVQSVTEDR